jgi:hypothetical protein
MAGLSYFPGTVRQDKCIQTERKFNMAANPNVGATPEPGAEGTPSQPVSPPESKPIGDDVTKMLADFGGKLDSLGKELRGLQGRQDRAENNQNDFQKQLARLEQYEKQGMTREEAIAEMQSDDAAEARWKSLEQKLDDLAGRLAGGGTQASGQQQVAKVFEAVGLDVKDPRVASALLTQYKTADEVELAAYRLLRQIQQSPNPNPAQDPSLNGGGGGGVQNQDALLAQLKELQKDPVRHRKEIVDLKKQLGW